MRPHSHSSNSRRIASRPVPPPDAPASGGPGDAAPALRPPAAPIRATASAEFTETPSGRASTVPGGRRRRPGSAAGPGVREDVGEPFRPVLAQEADEQVEELVDAVERDVRRDRGEFEPCRELGIQPVHDRLVAHPADPEAHGLVRKRVPGGRRVSWTVLVEDRGQRGAKALVEHSRSSPGSGPSAASPPGRRRAGCTPPCAGRSVRRGGRADLLLAVQSGQDGTLSAGSAAAIAARRSRKSSPSRPRSQRMIVCPHVLIHVHEMRLPTATSPRRECPCSISPRLSPRPEFGSSAAHTWTVRYAGRPVLRLRRPADAPFLGGASPRLTARSLRRPPRIEIGAPTAPCTLFLAGAVCHALHQDGPIP